MEGETIKRREASTRLNRNRCEIRTRVMGYHRPVQYYNEWKKSEFYQRKYFDVEKTNNDFNNEYGW